jgi:hypothetical protein
MMTTNPSHILIARNSRGPNNPIASLSSPTETHAAAAGIFRSSGSPPWVLQEYESDDLVSELSIEDPEEAIELDETFTRTSRFPGTVKIVVENTTFWFVAILCSRFVVIIGDSMSGRTKKSSTSPLRSSRQP